MEKSSEFDSSGYLQREQARLRELAEERGVSEQTLEIQRWVLTQYERMGLSQESRILITAVNTLKSTVSFMPPQRALNDAQISSEILSIIQKVRVQANQHLIDLKTELTLASIRLVAIDIHNEAMGSEFPELEAAIADEILETGQSDIQDVLRLL